MINRLLLLAVTIAVVSLGSGSWTGDKPLAVPPDDYDKKLEELGHELPPAPKPVGIYKRVVISGNMAYLAGHIPVTPEGEILTGKVGDDTTIDQAQLAAQKCGLGMLATLKSELGSLNRIERLVKTTGMVNCTDDFTQQPSVINGCSQLFKDIFGDDRGVGARAAVGMSSLPRGAIVEIEAIFELKD